MHVEYYKMLRYKKNEKRREIIFDYRVVAYFKLGISDSMMKL